MDEQLREKVSLAIGEASVCWVDGFIPTGQFDSTKAIKVADELCGAIEVSFKSQLQAKDAEIERLNKANDGLRLQLRHMSSDCAEHAEDLVRAVMKKNALQKELAALKTQSAGEEKS